MSENSFKNASKTAGCGCTAAGIRSLTASLDKRINIYNSAIESLHALKQFSSNTVSEQIDLLLFDVTNSKNKIVEDKAELQKDCKKYTDHNFSYIASGPSGVLYSCRYCGEYKEKF